MQESLNLKRWRRRKFSQYSESGIYSVSSSHYCRMEDVLCSTVVAKLVALDLTCVSRYSWLHCDYQFSFSENFHFQLFLSMVRTHFLSLWTGHPTWHHSNPVSMGSYLSNGIISWSLMRWARLAFSEEQQSSRKNRPQKMDCSDYYDTDINKHNGLNHHINMQNTWLKSSSC